MMFVMLRGDSFE